MLESIDTGEANRRKFGQRNMCTYGESAHDQAGTTEQGEEGDIKTDLRKCGSFGGKNRFKFKKI